jgi:hypothetical protein
MRDFFNIVLSVSSHHIQEHILQTSKTDRPILNHWFITALEILSADELGHSLENMAQLIPVVLSSLFLLVTRQLTIASAVLSGLGFLSSSLRILILVLTPLIFHSQNQSALEF